MLSNHPILKVKNLKVQFGRHVILDDLSFTVGEDETLAIIGPNGAGKTVLFKALLGLVPFTGEINWQPNLKIGYVPQKLVLPRDLPLTTWEFMKLKEKDPAKIYQVLADVGFAKDKPHTDHLKKHILDNKIGVLSGGEAQRVLIAFALLGDPDVMLFDEPTTGVDLSAEETIYGLLHKLQAKQKLALILISHELGIVYKYANQVICLNKERVCYGVPREVLNKENLEKLYGADVTLYPHRH